MTGLRSALWLPLFDDLADRFPAVGRPRSLARPRPWIGSAAVGSSSVSIRAMLRDGPARPSGE